MGRMIKTRSAKFLTEYEDQSDDDSLVIPEDLSALSDEELGALAVQASEAFNALYQGGEAQLDEADLGVLSSLAEGIEALNAETESREAALATRREAAAELAARVAPPLASDAEAGDGESDEAGDGESDEADGEDSEDSESDEDTDDSEDTEGDGDAVTAGATRQELRVNLGNLRSRQTAPRGNASTSEAPTMRDIVMAAPDVPGFTNGQGMDFSDMGRAVDSRLSTFNKASYEAANKRGKHIRQQFGVAVIQKSFPSDLVVQSNDPDHIETVFARAVDESRLPQGSLVASGGWCAPSETVYDLFELESRDGLFSLPEVNISRGGLRFTPGPDFASIFAATGFTYTEQQDIDGDYDGEGGGSKPCFKVDCPDFEDVRLDLAGVCITAGLLQSRGYPEVIARTIRGALIAHAHRVSALKINEVVAGSTAVSLPADQVGALAPILTAIELQVEHYRNVHRMSRTASLEAVFPFWVRGAIRSDLSRRLGVDLIDVPDSKIQAWFTTRGISAQFVYNWQDVGTTAASGFTAWPEQVQFLLYSAGTWVAGGSDIITLDTVYDSTLLGVNDYTALFTEEGWLVAKRGHDSRLVTVPICPTGDTGGGVAIECDGSAAA